MCVITAFSFSSVAFATSENAYGETSDHFLYDTDEEIGVYIYGYTGTETTLEIPKTINEKSVNEIYFQDFPDNIVFENITIPEHVEYITLVNPIKCKNYNCDEKNKNLCALDGVIYNKNKTELILYPNANTRADFTIPESVTSIKSFSFYESENLVSVTLSKNIKSIEIMAFAECKNLKTIKKYPMQISAYGYNCFQDTAIKGLVKLISDLSVLKVEIDAVFANKEGNAKTISKLINVFVNWLKRR